MEERVERAAAATSRTRRILLVAGEASGDHHAADLIAELGRQAPGVEVRGVGGAACRSEGMDTIIDANELATMGLTEVFERAPVLWRSYRRLVRELRQERPDLLVLVDFPEFNLALARVAKRAGVPVFYYVSPQVWAWRRGRVRKILRRVDRLAVVFPFETEVYRNDPRVSFVGHPLIDRVRVTETSEETRRRLGIDPEGPLIVLLPGSRRSEVEKLLPPMVEAAERLRRDRPVQFAVGLASTIPKDFAESFVQTASMSLPVVENAGYNLMHAADLVLASSGTVTLETALLEKPMVLMYRVSRMTYLAARLVVRVPAIGMPNLIAGKRIVPELLQGEVTGERIAAEAKALLDDPERYRATVEALREVRLALGSEGAAARAAGLALEVASRSLPEIR